MIESSSVSLIVSRSHGKSDSQLRQHLWNFLVVPNNLPPMYCLFLCRYDIPSHIRKGTQGKHQSPPPAPKKAVLQLKYLELWTMRAMSFPCSLPVHSFRKQCPEVSSKLCRFLLIDDSRNTFFSQQIQECHEYIISS